MPYRCDVITVQIRATQINDQGQPIGEIDLPPAKIFRASTPDLWAEVDKAVDQLADQIAKAKG